MGFWSESEEFGPVSQASTLSAFAENTFGKRPDIKKPNRRFASRTACEGSNVARKTRQSLHSLQDDPAVQVAAPPALLELFQNLSRRCAHEILSVHQ